MISTLLSTLTVVDSVASNRDGSTINSGRSTANCSATVPGRPAIRRSRPSHPNQPTAGSTARSTRPPAPARGDCDGTGRPRPRHRPSRSLSTTPDGQIFGDNVAPTAMIDRLIHHSEILSLKGDSYRLKNRDLARTHAAATEDA